MKKNISIFSLLIIVVLFTTCKKTPEIPTGSNKIEFGETKTDSISYFTTEITTTLTSTGGNEIIQHGHCWSTEQEPTTEDSLTTLGNLTQPKTFTSELTELIPNTKYYIRSYITYKNGTAYGIEQNISTLKTGIPVVSTSGVSNITLYTAQCGGNTVADSGLLVITKGVCWSTDSTVNIENNIGFTLDGDSLGTFTSNITDLNEGVNYFVKAYATNALGTSYGEVVQFTTVPITIPEVITSEVTDITINSAQSGGNITSNGDGTVSARGIVWSTNQNPTIDSNDGLTEDGTGIGTFTSSLTNLQDGILYYVRSYATNEKGTAYGEQISFQTIGIGFPIITTNNVINVTATTASCGGNISSAGNGSITVRGICWNLTGSPTLDNNINFTTDGEGIGSFNSNLTGLIEGTQYYVVAYATNEVGTAYGSVKNFITVDVNAPEVITNSASNITTTSATAGGNVTNGGNQDVTQRGVCWNTNSNLTLENSLGNTIDGTGTGNFVSSINDLMDGTLYYFRAYAINIEGTGYGEIKQFTTINISLPTVTTNEITNITNNSATSGGNVTNDGNSSVTARGICWSTTNNPTISNNHTTNGIGIGAFTSILSSLTPTTQYYVRAYATNSEGTAYGNEITFITLSDVILPTVITDDATNITQTTATSGGDVTDDGGADVTARGVCWSISNNPTLADSYTTDGTGTGTFVSDITGLSENTQYYVRAYATNSEGTAYGNEITFTTLVYVWQCGDLLNYEGQDYTTVLIGTQCWMAENLNVGTRIDGTQEQTDNSQIEKYCYDDDEANCDTYGGLYQWDEMMEYTTSQGVQGICPSGWHLPSDEEWKILEGTVDTQFGVGDPEWDNEGYRGFDAGKRLKTTTGWYQNTGTNASGFSGLPGGYNTNTYFFLGEAGYWWTSTEDGSTNGVWFRHLQYDLNGVYRHKNAKSPGYSVRCIKD